MGICSQSDDNDRYIVVSPHGKRPMNPWKATQNAGQAPGANREIAAKEAPQRPPQAKQGQWEPPPPEYVEAKRKLTEKWSMDKQQKRDSRIGARSGKYLNIDDSSANEEWFQRNSRRVNALLGY